MAKELITKSQDSRGHGQGLLYCSVLQVYHEEITDLMSIPTTKNEKGGDKRRVPYFNKNT